MYYYLLEFVFWWEPIQGEEKEVQGDHITLYNHP